MGKKIDTLFSTVTNAFATEQKGNSDSPVREFTYEWNLITDDLVWDRDFYRILGYSKKSFPTTLQAWENRIIHPADSGNIKKKRYRHLKTGTPCYMHYRVRQKNGQYVSLTVRGKAVFNEQGTPYKWKGRVRFQEKHRNPKIAG